MDPSSAAVKPARWALRLVALALGGAHIAVAMYSQSMNEDGIGYLDLGDAWWRGERDSMINTTWSPLYAWIVGAVLKTLQPPLQWQFPTVQLVNLAIYAVALRSFESFWDNLGQHAARRCAGAIARSTPIAWLVLGYSLFIYVSLNLNTVWAVTPDLLVSALVYLAAALILRLYRTEAMRRDAWLLGAVLGLAYLAKAAMFPLGLAVLALLVVFVRTPAARWRNAMAVPAFVAVAAPWFVVISLSVGHATFSDVGRFTYLKHVNQMPWPDWQNAPAELAGAPVHAASRINDDPPVWAFGSPIGGTYPLAYDPAWWSRGLRPSVDPGQQLQTIATNGVYYFDLFVRMQAGLIAAAIVLFVFSGRAPRGFWTRDAASVLLVWCLGGFALYALVYVEGRYIAPFVAVFWGSLLILPNLPATDSGPRIARATCGLAVLFLWLNVAALNVAGLGGLLGFRPTSVTASEGAARGRRIGDGGGVSQVAIARALRDAGIVAGERVAFVGYSYSAYWARLAGVKIVAEVRPQDAATFWRAEPLQVLNALESMRRAGATAVVAEPGGKLAEPAGWEHLGPSGYLFMRLDQVGPAAAR